MKYRLACIFVFLCSLVAFTFVQTATHAQQTPQQHAHQPHLYGGYQAAAPFDYSPCPPQFPNCLTPPPQPTFTPPPIPTVTGTPSGQGGGNNVSYGGGPVMAGTTQVYAIFWEPTGSTVSANYNSLLARYFGDVGGSGLYHNNTQYTDSNGNYPSNAVLGGTWTDSSAYSVTKLADSDIQSEVSKAMNANSWTADNSHLFVVFTAKGEPVCTGSLCSDTTFCGYHNYFGTNTVYASVPYPSGNQRCQSGSSPNNDADADSAINITSHEQMEAATDPLLNAWGGEIGDKCVGHYASGLSSNQAADVQWNGNYYFVQTEWDNHISGCAISGP